MKTAQVIEMWQHDEDDSALQEQWVLMEVLAKELTFPMVTR